MIRVNGTLQQPNSGRIINSPQPLGMKVWVTSQKKEPQPADVLAEVKGIGGRRRQT